MQSAQKVMLALDISSKTGWAVKSGDVITSGVYDLSGLMKEDFGKLVFTFEKWICDMIVTYQVTDFVIERPLGSFPGRTGFSDVVKALVLVSHAMGYAHNVRRKEVSRSSWHKLILGYGRYKSAEGKKRSKRWALEQGFNPKDDNEADALGILSWGLITIRGEDDDAHEAGR